MKKLAIYIVLLFAAVAVGKLAVSETADYLYSNTGTVEFKDNAKIGDDMTFTFGADDDITVQYDEDGDNDLQFSGDVSFEGSTINANGNPITNAPLTETTDIDNETLTASETGSVFDNQGDTDTTVFTLPTASAGLTFTFIDVEAGADIDVCIKAASGDKIENGSTAEYYNCYDDTYGSSIILIAVDATEWVSVSEAGSWTADSDTNATN